MRKNTIAARFSFYSFLILFLLVFTLSSIHLYRSYNREIERMDLEFLHIRQIFKPNLVMDLWLTDYSSLEENLENIVLYPYINRVHVTDDRGNEYSAGNPDTEGLECITEDLQYKRRDTEVYVGSLSVFIDRGCLRADVLKKELLPFIILCVLATILAFLISLLFRSLAGKHISKLALFLKNNDVTTLSTRFALDRRKNPDDELTFLVDAVNQMREDISAYIEDKKRLEHDLSEANDELKKIIEQKDKYLSILAHDLRSPFSGFLGLTRTLHEYFDTFTEEERREATGELKHTAETVYNLLENLLEWSRIERGAIRYSPEPVRIADIIETDYKLFKSKADRKDIEIESSVHRNIVVWADPEMLHSIIRNLLSNAIKYSDREGKIVFLAQESNTAARITLRDSGKGMDQDTLSRIFGGSPVMSEKGTDGERGSGLGLLITREFIEIHGGEIYATSTPGKGTDITFTLPLFS